jgi:hypothetical protein
MISAALQFSFEKPTLEGKIGVLNRELAEERETTLMS